MHFVFTGTESTFKSTIAKKIAIHFNLLYIPEFARTYLEEISPNTQINPIVRKDYNLIEEGQLALLSSQGYFDSNQPKVFDTDGTVLHIWKTDKFDVIDHELLNIPSHIIYFLCYPNVEGGGIFLGPNLSQVSAALNDNGVVGNNNRFVRSV